MLFFAAQIIPHESAGCVSGAIRVDNPPVRRRQTNPHLQMSRDQSHERKFSHTRDSRDIPSKTPALIVDDALRSEMLLPCCAIGRSELNYANCAHDNMFRVSCTFAKGLHMNVCLQESPATPYGLRSTSGFAERLRRTPLRRGELGRGVRVSTLGGALRKQRW